MRSFISAAAISAVAFNAADTASGTALAVIETPAFNAADTAKSNIAIKPARKPRALSGAAVAKPAAKPEAAKAEKPAADMHAYGTSYNGASPPVRTHAKLLSPIVLNRTPNSFTERDSALLKALHSAHGTKQFQRLNIDAGALSRLIGHGYVSHASGNLDQRDCKFAITAKAVKQRLTTVAAPKA